MPFHRSTAGMPPETPTAKQLVVLGHDTLFSPPTLGLGTIAQLVPFHRSIRAPPTAKQLVVLVHDTLDSPPTAPGGLGLGTITNGGPAADTCADAAGLNGTATSPAAATTT